MYRILLLFFCLHLGSHLGVAETPVRIGSNPNIWFPQPAVIIGEGWDREEGFTLQHKLYPGPAHNLQGFVAGELDGVNNNIAAAMLASDRGKKLRIVAGTTIGDISLIVHSDVSRIPGSNGLERLRRFKEQTGRRFRLVTNPRGSLSEVTMRRFLETSWPEFASGIELVHAGDQATMQQLFFSHAADGCAGFGSLLWLFQAKDPEVKEMISPDELMTDQPGGVLMMSSEFVDAHPAIVRSLQKLYRRATQFIRDNPEKAATHIDAHLTRGLVPMPILTASIHERVRFMESDLEKLKGSSEKLADYLVGAGYLKQKPDLSALFLRESE